MRRVLPYGLILFGLFFGLVSLIPGSFDKAAYIYFRVVNGSSIEVGGECVRVPSGWAIFRVDDDDRRMALLYKKLESEFVYVSVGAQVDIPNPERLMLVTEVPDAYGIYSLDVDGDPTNRNLISIVPGQNLLLVSEHIDSLVELSRIKWNRC